MPTWMDSVIAVIVGATTAGIATYVASYVLEKEKWLASAAILRKDNVYSPVYDELSSMHKILDSPKDWFGALAKPSFREWEKLRDRSSAFTVPKALSDRLNGFANICNRYAEARSLLYQQIRQAFPEMHLEQDDFGIAYLLADKMLVAPQAEDSIVIEHLRAGRPTLPDLFPYWTNETFEATRRRVQSLEAWLQTEQLHSEYVRELQVVRADVSKRIQRIVQRYQHADSWL